VKVVVASLLVLLTSTLPGFSSRASASANVTWEEQAERLQNVSATLLDGVPFADPAQSPMSLEGRMGVSFLPRVDPRVGAKREEVPTSPIHAIPTLQLNARRSALGLQMWGGYLPPGGEEIFGIDAKFRQWSGGASAQAFFAGGAFDVGITLGAQHSDAELEGAITSANAQDNFRVRSTLAYAGPVVVHRASGLWSSAVVGVKRTRSTFEIPSDGTRIALDDRLADARPPLYSQVALGWLHASGVQVGSALLWVPERLIMPRLLLSYQFMF
jgi:hypothetical protein